MEKQTGDFLLKKGKKYKKWGEQMLVNPFYWVENGKPYYPVAYLSGGKSVASGFFSTEEGEVKEDALRAHPPLAIYSDLSANIFNIAADRENVNMGYFTKLLGIPFHSEDQQAAKGREVYAELSKYQDEFATLLKEFTSYYDNDVMVRGKLEESDILKVKETAVTVQLLQYRIITTVKNQAEELQKFEDYLKTREEWKELNKDNRSFIKGMLSGVDKSIKELAALNIIVDEDQEKMYQLNYDYLVKDLAISMESQKKNIRYPK